MCGIAGYVDRSGRHPGLATDLEAAVRALRHRGPNDEGTWQLDPGVGLGHTRLSILDLSSNGHQPMVSEDGQVVMSYNGEVYNFAEIRATLAQLGHHFRGTGDSEVVLAAFREWGMAAIERLIGMFAIALWDRKTKRLSLVRDRLGVKPLYYGWDGEVLWFGSELKALRAFSHWKVELDRQALSEYFQFGYINAPRSIYARVHKLQPGHLLSWDAGAEPVVQCYWSITEAIKTPLHGSEAQLTAQLEALLIDAFKLRLVSDVPVGVFLSGGIDSSLVTALLQRHTDTPIHTFTIGFTDEGSDESGYARRVAEHLGTIHTERVMHANDARELLPVWGRLFDEPFCDSSGLPTYLVSRLASEHVKVVLSADGGDESFSGYVDYDSMIERWRRREALPGRLVDGLRWLLEGLPLEALDRAAGHVPGSLRRGLHYLTGGAIQVRDVYCAPTLGEAYTLTVSVWRPRELAALLGAPATARPTADAFGGQISDKLSLWDLHNYLPGDILAKVDRATMAASIEGREPLLDHRVVEFALRLPVSMRRGSLGPKHVLKSILYRYMPRELIDRPKHGFAVPLRDWLRNDFAPLVDTHLSEETVRRQGILNPNVVTSTVTAFRNGDDRMLNRVWSLLAFQMWREQWL